MTTRAPAPIKPAVMTRSVDVDVRAAGSEKSRDATTFNFTAATENPVRVFDWETWEVVREILPISGANVREYLRNPVVLDAHRRFGSEFVAGMATRVEKEEDEGRIGVEIEFDDEPGSTGERNLRLVRKGMLRTLSIGYTYNPARTTEVGVDEESGERIVRREEWDLIEVSTAPIPADPDATKRSLEEALAVTTKKATKKKKAAKKNVKANKGRRAEDDEEEDEEEEESRASGEKATDDEEETDSGDDGGEDESSDGGDEDEDEEERAGDERAAEDTPIEEEAERIRAAAKVLVDDVELQERLVQSGMLSDDPAEYARELEARGRLLKVRVIDPELREIGGRLIAEAEEPLEVDVISALRRELAKRPPVGTPDQTGGRSEGRRDQDQEGDDDRNKTPAGGDLIRLMEAC